MPQALPATNRRDPELVAAAAPGDDEGLCLAVLDGQGRPRRVLGGDVLARVALPRAAGHRRGDPVTVELERTDEGVVVRMWCDDELGVVERRVEVPGDGW